MATAAGIQPMAVVHGPIGNEQVDWESCSGLGQVAGGLDSVG